MESIKANKQSDLYSPVGRKDTSTSASPSLSDILTQPTDTMAALPTKHQINSNLSSDNPACAKDLIYDGDCMARRQILSTELVVSATQAGFPGTAETLSLRNDHSHQLTSGAKGFCKAVCLI